MAKQTCLYDKHIEAGGKIVDFAGFDLPIQYEGIMAEHEVVRKAVGLFDVSHMGKFQVAGKNAQAFINEMVTNDISVLVDGQAAYTPMCYEHGGTVDDILVYRYSESSYLLVVNAANKTKDYEWLEDHLYEGVQLMDITDTICQIAVQGPKAVELVQSLTQTNIADIGYYHFKNDVPLADVPMLVSRTGYTGEDGFELYFDQSQAHAVWQILLDKGADYGIKPCGLGARDTLRFEAGMPLYGNELAEDINPIEAGLNYFVKLDKTSFIGKNALTNYKADRRRKMVGFELLDKGMPRHGAEVVDQEGKVIGLVTTGYKSPTFGVTIGVAIVPWSYKEDNLFIQVRKKTLKAKVVSKRFMKTYGNE